MSESYAIDPDVWNLTPEGIRQRELQKWQAIEDEARRRNATTGPEGGRYLTADGRWIDAEGNPIKSK